jgi:hypothetical protein
MQHCSTSNNNLSLSTVTSRLASGSAMTKRGNHRKSAFFHTHQPCSTSLALSQTNCTTNVNTHVSWPASSAAYRTQAP